MTMSPVTRRNFLIFGIFYFLIMAHFDCRITEWRWTTNVLKCLYVYTCFQNQQPGAEEAFKILGHAFDLIGDAVSISVASNGSSLEIRNIYQSVFYTDWLFILINW